MRQNVQERSVWTAAGGSRPGSGLWQPAPAPAAREVPRAAFDRLRAAPDWVTHCEAVPLGKAAGRRISIHSLAGRGLVVVTLAHGPLVRRRQFRSRAEGVTLESRRQGLPVVDMHDAFAVGEKMARAWPAPQPE